MCGVVAIFSHNGPPVSRSELEGIRDRMTHRGPDGFGLWLSDDGIIGLAHRRLSIIDLSESAAQPMHSHDGSLTISYNGEIYNYAELRNQLEKKGHLFKTSSDTEVLLHLYEEDGEDMFRHLRGMFAIALWDSRRHGLLLARDPYGIKPLYISDNGKTIRVASQVKALLVSDEVDKSVDASGHVGFFLWGHVPEPYTMYKGIRSVRPGSTLWIDERGHAREQVFGDLTETIREAEDISSSTDSVSMPEFKEAIIESVRYHLVADVDVGVFLSAGLDSTALLGLASQLGGRLNAVTLGFDEFRSSQYDESALASVVAKQYGANHNIVWIERNDFENSLDKIFYHMDQPTIDGVNTFFVSRAAAQSGLKVVISGLGGDELLGGYPSFREIPKLVGAMRVMPKPQIIGKVFRVVTAPLFRRLASPKYASLFEYGGDYGGAYLLRRGLYMPWELFDILDADLVREGWEVLNTRARLGETYTGIELDRLKITALESAWYMRHQLLRDSDWAGMAHSLEIRVPLVDWNLLRRITPLLVSDPNLGKKSLAQLPVIPLPAKITSREKSGFTIPVRDWMLERKAISSTEPGYRGWARYVYERQIENT